MPPARGPRPAAGGGTTPPVSIWTIKLVQTVKAVGKGTVQATVFENANNAPDGTEVTFTLNSIAIGIVKTVSGKAEQDFTLPKGIATGAFEADVLKPRATPGKLTVTVDLPATAPDLTAFNLYYRRIRIAPGKYTLPLQVRDPLYNAKASGVVVVADKHVTIAGVRCEPGKEETLNLPESGAHWPIEFTEQQIKLDLTVKLINKHYEVVLHGPCPCAPPVTTGDGKGWIAHLVAGWQGVVPQRRFFAGWLLLGLIFATYYGSWKAPVFWTALCMAMEVLWTRTKGLEAAADIQNELFGAIMGTNNRWWSTGVMAFLFCSLLCLMIALFVPAADEPVPVQSAQVLAERSQPKSLHEQRMANQQRFREYKTDTEIRAEGKTLPTAAETSTGKKSGFWLSLILPDESYMGWIIRLVITFVLIGGGTFCYTFVAFSDEFRRLVHESWEQGEQGGPKFGLMNFLGFLKNLPKNPPLLSSRPQEFSWGRLLTLALAAFEASEIVNGIRHIVARIR